MRRDLNKLTRKELAGELYEVKKRLGDPMIPIGRTTQLTKQEFTKRYLNGVGGTTGFKKAELISLLERRLLEEKRKTIKLKFKK